MKNRGFKISTEGFKDGKFIENEYECDLISHDTTGDIVLYNYREVWFPSRNRANLDKFVLVAKFESHVEWIIKVEYFDLGDNI